MGSVTEMGSLLPDDGVCAGRHMGTVVLRSLSKLPDNKKRKAHLVFVSVVPTGSCIKWCACALIL